MSDAALSELLTLPPSARADLAIALWASLSDDERETALATDQAFLTELDRRWAEHLANPESAVPWESLLRKLRG
jgi:putative addiction module component (TIGR02574 family)